MSNFNKELLDEINFLRTNPRRYSKKLSKYIDYFKDNVLYIPGTNVGIPTEEGAEAYKQAIDSLLKESRREPLIPSKGLCQVAETLVSEAQKDADNVGNIDIEKMIKKMGTYKGCLSRIFEFGGETPEQVVVNSVVCDGDPSRGQRQSLLNAEVKRIGIANGKHEAYGHVTTLVTITEFKNNEGTNDEGFLDGDYVPKEINLENDDNDEKEEGVASVERTEQIVMENGKKKKIIKIIKYMEDGTKQIETIKENVKE